MKLEITINQVDSIEIHRQFENLFNECKGGMEPIELTGKFRFTGEFECSQQHRSEEYRHGRETRFGLLLIDAQYSAKKI